MSNLGDDDDKYDLSSDSFSDSDSSQIESDSIDESFNVQKIIEAEKLSEPEKSKFSLKSFVKGILAKFMSHRFGGEAVIRDVTLAEEKNKIDSHQNDSKSAAHSVNDTSFNSKKSSSDRGKQLGLNSQKICEEGAKIISKQSKNDRTDILSPETESAPKSRLSG